MTSGISMEIGCPASRLRPRCRRHPIRRRRAGSPWWCGVGANERIGIGEQASVDLLLEDHPREVLEIDLMDDAGVRRNDAEVLERVLAPAQERVAFAVAREFEPGVEVGSVGFRVVIDLNGVIDDEPTGCSGLTLRGSPPRRRIPSRIAARSTTAGTPVKS